MRPTILLTLTLLFPGLLACSKESGSEATDQSSDATGSDGLNQARIDEQIQGLLGALEEAKADCDCEEKPAVTGDASASLADEDVIATIGDLVISTDDFKTAAARKVPASGTSLSDAEKKEVLDNLISQKLLYVNGLELGVDQDPKVQKVVVNTLLRDVVYKDITNNQFPEADLRAYYNANRDDFVIQAKVQIRRILIRETADRDAAASKAEADRLHKEIKADSSRFRELAAKFSDGDFKRRGGDMGFVPKSGKPGIDQALVDKAFGMAANEVSSVFKTSDGYNILMVAKKRERHERTFQQVRGAVLRKLKNDRMKALMAVYVGVLKQNTAVSVDDNKLSGINVEAKSIGGARSGAGPMLTAPNPTKGGGLPKLEPGIHPHGK